MQNTVLSKKSQKGDLVNGLKPYKAPITDTDFSTLKELSFWSQASYAKKIFCFAF